MLGDGERDREAGVDARDERGGVSDVIPRKLRGIVNIVQVWGTVHEFILIGYNPLLETRFRFVSMWVTKTGGVS